MSCCGVKATTKRDLRSSTSSRAGVDLEFVTPAYFKTFAEGYEQIITEPTPVTALEEFGFDVLFEISKTVSARVRDVVATEEGRVSYPFVSDLVYDSNVPERWTVPVVDLSNFVDYGGYTVEDLQEQVEENPFAVAEILDDYYETKATGGQYSLANMVNNVCAFVSMPFGIVTQLEKLLNMSSDTESLNGSLKNFIDNIKKGVDKLVKKIITTIQNTANTIQRKFNSIPNKTNGVLALMRNVDDTLSDISAKLSQGNIDNMKKKFDTLLTRISYFSKNPNKEEMIKHILYMFCGITDQMEQELRKPVDDVKKISDNSDRFFQDLQFVSGSVTQEAVQRGRKAITDDSRAQAAARVDNAMANNPDVTNGTAPTRAYVPKLSGKPSSRGWSNLTFRDTVVNNSFYTTDRDVHMRTYYPLGLVPTEYQNPVKLGMPVDTGYQGVKVEVLERANEVAKSLGVTFEVTSAYRPYVYNQHLRNTGTGASVHSRHIKGEALDIIWPGGVTASQIKTAARAYGFGGFGTYNTFFHIDIGPVRSW